MGDTPTGKILRAAVPAIVMGIAVFMILTQLGIAPVIVTITYVALVGSAALAAALAFGLGGRDAAAELINSGYRKAQKQKDTVRQDVQTQPSALRPTPSALRPTPSVPSSTPSTSTARPSPAGAGPRRPHRADRAE